MLNHLKKNESLEDKQLVLISSDERDDINQSSSSFTYTFDKPIKRVSKMDVIYSKVPKTYYNLNNDNASMSITTNTFTESRTDILVIDDNELKSNKIQATNIIDGFVIKSNILRSDSAVKITKVLTKNSNLYASGIYENVIDFKDFTGESANKPLYNSGLNDLFIARYSLEQELQMRFKIGGVMNDTNIDFDVFNNIIFSTGVFASLNLLFYNSDNSLASSITSDGNLSSFLSRYEDGTFKWGFKIIGLISKSLVKIDSVNQLVYLSGTFSKNLEIFAVSGSYSFAKNNDDNNVFILQCDFNGVINWISVIQSKCVLSSIAINTLTNCPVLGITYNEEMVFRKVYPSDTIDATTLKLNGLQNVAIIEYKTDGSILDAIKIGGSNIDSDIQIDIVGDSMAVCGLYKSNPLVFSNTSLLNNTGLINNIFVAQYNITNTGKNLAWYTNIYDEIDSVERLGVSISNIGEILLIGNYSSNLRFNDINGYVKSKDLLNPINLANPLNLANQRTFIAKYINGVFQYRTHMTSDICEGVSIDAHSNNVYTACNFTGDEINLFNSDDSNIIVSSESANQQGIIVSLVNNSNNYIIDSTILPTRVIYRYLTGSDLSYILNLNSFSQQLGIITSTQFQATVFGLPINWSNINITALNDTLLLTTNLGDKINKTFVKKTYEIKITIADNYTPYNMAYEVNTKLLSLLNQNGYLSKSPVFIYNNVSRLFYINIIIDGTFNITMTDLSDALRLPSKTSIHCIITQPNQTLNSKVVDNSKLTLKARNDLITTRFNDVSFTTAFPNITSGSNILNVNAQTDKKLSIVSGLITDKLNEDIQQNDTITFDAPWLPEDINRLTFLDPLDWVSIDTSADGLKIVLLARNGQIYISNDGGEIWQIKESSRNWCSVSISADAVIRTAAVCGGQLYVSTNSGVTWIAKDSNRDWKQAVVSRNSGLYQLAISRNDKIFISSNYGNSWSSVEEKRYWVSADISADGQYQTAIVYNGSIYRSTNFGVNWNVVENTVGEWQCISMSNSGQFQSAIVSDTYVYHSTDYGATWVSEIVSPGAKLTTIKINKTTGNEKIISGNVSDIYYSNNLGGLWTSNRLCDAWSCHTFSENNTVYFIVSNGGIYESKVENNKLTPLSEISNKKNWMSCAMSSDGVIQAAISYNELFISNDSGINWYKNNNFADLNIFYSFNDVKLSHIAMSSNGQYIYCIIYPNFIRSSDFGTTWTIVDNNINQWIYKVRVSSTGKYVTISSSYIETFIKISEDYGLTFNVRGPPLLTSTSMSSDGSYHIGLLTTGNELPDIYPYRNFITISRDYWNTYELRPKFPGTIEIIISGDTKTQIAKAEFNNFISTDYGNTWTQFALPIVDRYYAISYDGKVILRADSRYGVYVSRDYCQTWKETKIFLEIVDCSISSDGSIMMFMTKNNIYNSINFGFTWNKVNLVYDNYTFRRDFVSASISGDGKTILYSDYNDKGLFISRNSGYSFYNYNQYISTIETTVSYDGQIIHIAEIHGDLYTSIDGGLTYSLDTLIVNGVPTVSEDILFINGIVSNKYGSKSIAECRGDNDIYVVVKNDINNQLFNNPWVIQTFPLDPSGLYIFGVAINETGSIMYALSRYYVYICENINGVENWQICYTILNNNSNKTRIACDGDGSKVIVYKGNKMYITYNKFVNVAIRDFNITSLDFSQLKLKMSYDGNTHLAHFNDNIYISMNDWTTYSSPNNSRKYKYANMSGNGKFMVATTAELVYKSSNYGKSWSILQYNRSPSAISLSAFGNVQTIVSKGRDIYTSNNKGNTWNVTPIINNWRDISLNGDGAMQIAVPFYGKIHVSNDSGVTWNTYLDDKYWSCCAVYRGAAVFAAAETNGPIYISIGDINTWNIRQSARNWKAISIAKQGSTIAAVVYGGKIYVSGDFGGNWNERGDNRNWQDVSVNAMGNIIIAVAYGGEIIFSIDNGFTWKYVEQNRLWKSVAMDDYGNVATAVVMGGQIYISNATLEIWTPVESNREWISVDMDSYGRYQTALVDNYDKVYYSIDFGKTWSTQKNIKELSSIAISSNGSIQTVAENGGTLYITSNFGQSWKQVEQVRPWRKVAMLSDGVIQTAMSYDGKLFYSDNTGETWNFIDIEMSEPLTAMAVANSSQLVACSIEPSFSFKKLIIVTNYMNSPAKQVFTLQGIGPESFVTGVAVDSNCYNISAVILNKSIKSWTFTGNSLSNPIDNNSPDANWSDIVMSGDSVIRAATAQGGKIYISTDSGVNWIAREENRNWVKIAMSEDGSKIIAIADGDKIYSSNDTGLTWKSSENNRQWRGLAISSNGDFQIACDINSVLSHPFNINERITLSVENVEPNLTLLGKSYMREIVNDNLVKIHDFNLANGTNFTMTRTITFPTTDIFIPPSNYTPQQLINAINAEIIKIDPEYIYPYGFSYDTISGKVSFNSKYSGVGTVLQTDLLVSMGFSTLPATLTKEVPIIADNVLDADFNGPRNLFIKSKILSELRKNKTSFSKNNKLQDIIAPLQNNNNTFQVPFPIELFLSKKETVEKIDIQIVDEYGNIVNLNGGIIQVNFYFYTS